MSIDWFPYGPDVNDNIEPDEGAVINITDHSVTRKFKISGEILQSGECSVSVSELSLTDTSVHAEGGGVWRIVGIWDADDNVYDNSHTWYVTIVTNLNTYISTTQNFSFQSDPNPPPEKPINPVPANKATRIAIDLETIDWTDGGAGQPNAAESYDVYFGLDENNLVLAAASQAATDFEIKGIANGSPFEYSQYRAWRIDAINQYGTTTGDIWVFYTGFWLSFPAQRFSNHDEDKVWDIASQAWTDDVDYLAFGGGRYKNQIVVVGHKKIYFGEI